MNSRPGRAQSRHISTPFSTYSIEGLRQTVDFRLLRMTSRMYTHGAGLDDASGAPLVLQRAPQNDSYFVKSLMRAKSPTPERPAIPHIRACLRERSAAFTRSLVKVASMTRTWKSAAQSAATASAVAALAAYVTCASAETRPSASVPSTGAPAAGVQATAPAALAAKLEPEPEAWTLKEISDGIARCSALLAGKDIVSERVPPFRAGDCGAAAAIKLISVGKQPEIQINPPVIVTCEVASTLATWVKTDLQPLARQHLGAPVVRIDTMSSYSCRNAYGRKRSRLSEHGRANAIDLRSFVTKTNEEASVFADWGTNDRKHNALVAAARAMEAKRAALAKADAAKKPLTEPAAAVAQAPTPRAPALTAPPAALALEGQSRTQQPSLGVTADRDLTMPLPRLGTLIEGIPGLGQRIPALRPLNSNTTFGEPSRLGGAKPAAETAPPAAATLNANKSRFLKAVHASACRVFGTVLGPEANAAHENHFHFDMAERARSNFCE
jgi:hypothetical protein